MNVPPVSAPGQLRRTASQEALHLCYLASVHTTATGRAEHLGADRAILASRSAKPASKTAADVVGDYLAAPTLREKADKAHRLLLRNFEFGRESSQAAADVGALVAENLQAADPHYHGLVGFFSGYFCKDYMEQLRSDQGTLLHMQLAVTNLELKGRLTERLLDRAFATVYRNMPLHPLLASKLRSRLSTAELLLFVTKEPNRRAVSESYSNFWACMQPDQPAFSTAMSRLSGAIEQGETMSAPKFEALLEAISKFGS